jgi:hypothetical protein
MQDADKLIKRFFIIIVMMTVQTAYSQTSYVSPGFGLAWNLNGEFVFSPKISIGVLEEKGTFYNLTIGHSSIYGETTVHKYFAEAQCGQVTRTLGKNSAQYG